MFAAMAGKTDVAQQLLWHGAERKLGNKHGRTAAETATFIGHHECASMIKQYLPEEVFETFTKLDGLSIQASPALARALFLFANQSDLRPLALWDYLHETTLLRPCNGRNWASDTAVEIIEIVSGMAFRTDYLNQPELGLKLTYLRTIFTWFVSAAVARKLTDDDEPSGEAVRQWRMSLRMSDIIISRVNTMDPKLKLATNIAGNGGVNESSSRSNDDGRSSKAASSGGRNKAARGHGKATPYFHLRALIDGPKFAAQLRDQTHCSMCYCSTADRAVPNAAGELCCSKECLELHQTHAGQL